VECYTIVVNFTTFLYNEVFWNFHDFCKFLWVLEWFLFVGVSSEKALFHMKIKFILLKNPMKIKFILLKNLTHVVTAFRYFAKLWNT